MRVITRDFLQQGSCTDCLPLHAGVLADLQTLLNAKETIKSHYFHGRYENIYIPAQKISGLDSLLGFLQHTGAALLDVMPQTLQLGFWFNVMHKGDITTLHSHDDNDELLSGTYYLQMPPGSGQLIIHQNHRMTTIDPITGHYAFFHPGVEHEVTVHQSDVPRISLGFNLGLRVNENSPVQ
jgi:hypothetical protein